MVYNVLQYIKSTGSSKTPRGGDVAWWESTCKDLVQGPECCPQQYKQNRSKTPLGALTTSKPIA